MYSYGPLHMAVQKQDDQLELTYSNYVRTQDVILKTCRRRWMIGRSGEKGSGISVLAARHDHDDDCDHWKHNDSTAVSSGFPWLSEYRNDSTWEIIFKVWLLIKQDIQESWRSYWNNDVIVYRAKYRKKHPTMNSKCKIQWHQLFLIFLIFKVMYFKENIWFGLFNYWFPYCVHVCT